MTDNFILVPKFSSVISSVSLYASLCFLTWGEFFRISGKLALAAAPSFRATKETANYTLLFRLIVDVGSHILRETFEKKRPPGKLDEVLSTGQVYTILKKLRVKGVLTPSQWGQLYPSIRSSVSSQNFDITLLVILLRNVCRLAPPVTGWNFLPSDPDTTIEADIARIKFYRNTVFSHASQASIDDETFSRHWQKIQNALVRLGGAGYQSVIQDLRKECIDPASEERHRELLKRMDEMEEKFEKKFDDLEVKMADAERRKETGVKREYSIIFTKHIFKILECIHVFKAFLNPDCFCVLNVRWLPSIRS